MKTERIIRLFLAVLVLFFVISDEVLGDGEWTPDNVEIVPENPTSADVVDITFSGNWPNSCIPNDSYISVEGNDIYFGVIRSPSGPCLTVFTPWQLTESVGPLSPGTYNLYTALDRGPWTLTTEFYVGEANVYVFVPEQSTVVLTGGIAGIHETYSIQGQLQLTVDFDAGTASFDVVDADLFDPSQWPDGFGADLGKLFDMTELVGTVISSTEIDFDTSDPLPGGKVVHLDLTLVDDSIQLTGGFCQPWPDGFCYDMSAIARKKIVSDEVSWIPGETSPPEWRVEPNCASTSDIIHFFGPTAIFANACVAEWDMGYPKLTFDPVNKTIELWFQPSMHEACPNVWEPVCGLEGSFGPLEVGQWLFFGNDPNATFSVPFEVDSAIDSNSIVEDGIKYYMQTDKSVYKLDEQVEMLYRVTNLTANPIDIEDILNCEYGYCNFVITQDGTHIWENLPVVPPCGVTTFHLDPYESREFPLTWNMTNDNGTLEPDDDFPVGSGQYDVMGELRLYGTYQRVPVSVTIEIIPFVYVDADATGADDGSSWKNAYSFLQDALADANSSAKPVEILVAQGVYIPDSNSAEPNGSGDRTATFQLINGVAIKGGYAGYGEPNPNARDIELYETILSGDLDGNDIAVNDPCDLLTEATRCENSYHILIWIGLACHEPEPNTLLDGFTVSGGNANGESDWPDVRSCGGGLYCYSGKTLMVTRCKFTGNSASDGSGGIWGCRGRIVNCLITKNAAGRHGGGLSYCPGLIEDCTISFNFAARRGGGYEMWQGDTNFHNCSFINNTAGTDGGGMFFADAGPRLSNCTFRGNIAHGSGGGVYSAYFDYAPTPMLINCNFSENTANEVGGGMCNAGSYSRLTNCIFSGNSADRGGGMANYDGSDVNLANCTFAGNSGQNGNALACDSLSPQYPWPSELQLSNCILWDGGNEIWNNDNSEITITYSDIQHDNWPGEGNIDADPCFADALNGDYHLKSEGWRWDKHWTHGTYWKGDTVSSRCIDAGNPGSPLGDELLTIPDDPNHVWGVNLRINMGAYGGTAEASMPPYGWALLGDLSNDGIVGYEDLAGQIEDWLTTASQQPGDLNRDGMVNMADFALLAQDWLQMTDWANRPPKVYITSPEDGALVPYNAIVPIPVEADASDVDGSVVMVEFFANGNKIGEDNNAGDGWDAAWHPESDGAFSLTVTATDDGGAKATSPVVEVEVGLVW